MYLCKLFRNSRSKLFDTLKLYRYCSFRCKMSQHANHSKVATSDLGQGGGGGERYRNYEDYNIQLLIGRDLERT